MSYFNAGIRMKYMNIKHHGQSILFHSYPIYREDNDKYEKQVSDLHARIRILETLQGSADPDLIGMAGGLCVKCAQNDAVLPPSVVYSQKRSVEKLTK